MGCHFPGASNYEEYWSNIFSNKCFIEELPPESDVMSNYDSNYKAWNRSSVKLCARVKPFDFPYKKFKGITPHSIDFGDFYIKYSLLAAQDAIDDAGSYAFEGNHDDVFVAVGHYNYETKAIRFHADAALRVFIDDLKNTPTFQNLSLESQNEVIQNLEKNFFHVNENLPHETIVASMGPAVASRITKLNKFNGGFTCVDSACASSVAAMDIAVRRLRDGSSKIAVVGGIGVLSPYFFVHCSKAHTMSTTGSFPFDKRASGFVVGEGSGFIVMKPLSEALKNKDRIHAVIRGVAGSSDGYQRGPWAPNKEGQKLAYTRALQQAGYAFDDIQYIECHGTGTQVGDKEELKGLGELKTSSSPQGDKVIIGSAKGSVGHLLPGAGMAGLIRVVMAFKKGYYPPTAGAENPIDELTHSPFQIITEAKEWKRINPNLPRRAMLNSFGYGGTNYNIQLEEFDEKFHENNNYLKQNLPVQNQVQQNYYLSPIAIVGMGVNLPGSKNLAAFHENNLLSKLGFSNTPEGRFNKKITDKLETIVGDKLSQLKGGYVDLPTEESKLHWRIPPTEIKDIDPNQFRLLEVVKASLEDAHLLDKKSVLEKTALICGVMMDSDFFAFEHTSIRLNALINHIRTLPNIPESVAKQLSQEFFEIAKKDLYELSKDSAVSGIDSMLGSRVAKFFDLKGGSLSLDAVCATGMVALDHGTRLLRSRELDSVVVCSSTMGMSAQLKECYNQMTGGWLNEPSKPFDQERQGFLIGEGAVAFVLKRLDDAIKEGNTIYSVIHSVGISSDGASSQMLQPSYVTAKKAFEKAISQAPPSAKVEMVECHGIGTITSDQIEMQIIKDLYAIPQKETITLGALKGAIGHLKVTAAFASVARAALSLYYNKKYPVVGFQNPDPFLSEEPTLQVLKLSEEYQHTERYCGVTSFGLGGVNGHLIMSNYNPSTTSSSFSSSSCSTIATTSEEKNLTKFKVEKAKAPLISGSALQRGKLMGQLWKKSFNNNYDHIWNRLPSNLFEQKQDLTETFLKWMPEAYKTEIEGIAQGAELPKEVVLWANCLTMAVTTQYGLCSGFIKNGFHGSNYDFPFVTKNDNALLPREVLEVHREGVLPFIGVFLLGSPFPYAGINSAGISISASSGTALGRVSDGLFIYAMIREILETCTDLSQVKTLIAQKTISGSWVLLIAQNSIGGSSDSFTNPNSSSPLSSMKSLHIEICESQSVIHEKEVVFATNHFQYMTEASPQRQDSLFRLQRLNDLIQNFKGSTEEGLDILSDKYDVSRERVTKFATSNTLNRYNSAVSALICPSDKKMYVSCQNIPSGEGPYKVYDLTFTQQDSIGLSMKSLLEKAQWQPPFRENHIKENFRPQIFLLHSHNTETYRSYLNQYSNSIFLLNIDNPDYEPLKKWHHLQDFDLIDINENDDALEFEFSIGLFQQKVQIIRQLELLQIKPKRIFSFGWDKSYVVSRPHQGISSTLASLSRPFFKSLLREGFCNDFFSFDVFRTFDIHFCLEQLIRGQIPSSHDLFCFNEELFEVGFIAQGLKKELLPKEEHTVAPNDVVLFTGGLSGIGFECLKTLINKHPQGIYIILGKTNLKASAFQETDKVEFLKAQALRQPGLKPKEYLHVWNQNQKTILLMKNWKTLQELTKNIHYYAVDLSDQQNVEKTLTQIQNQHGYIQHIVHSAGMEISKHFNKKSEQEFNSVFLLKTIHSLNLFKSIDKRVIKNVLLFSSIAAEFGNEGQSDYSSSNGFYKALSLHLISLLPQASVKNILWSGWDEVGMAAKDHIKPLLLSKGYTLMPVHEGTKSFLQLFQSNTNFYQILAHALHDKSISKPNSAWIAQDVNQEDTPFTLVDQIVLKNENTYIFEKEFSGEELFLKDHIIKGKRTIPGVFWLDMLIQALNSKLFVLSLKNTELEYLSKINSSSLNNSDSFLKTQIDEINFIELCSIDPKAGKKVRLKLQKKSEDQWDFSFSSLKESVKRDLLKMETIHSNGKFSLKSNNDSPLSEKKMNLLETRVPLRPGNLIYNALSSSFSGYIGKSYRCIESFQVFENKINLYLNYPQPFYWGYIFDTINQSAVLWSPQSDQFNFLPHSLSEIKIAPHLQTMAKQLNATSSKKDDATRASMPLSQQIPLPLSSEPSVKQLLITLELLKTETNYLTFTATIFDKITGNALVSIKTVKHKIFGNNKLIRENHL